MFKSKKVFNEIASQICVDISKFYNSKSDFENAFKYAKKANDLENKESIILLSDAYQKGEGVEKDTKKAFELLLNYSNSKELDEYLAIAQFNLSNMYSKGIGTEVDFEKSNEYLKKSADNGFTLAQYTYAGLLEKGQNGLDVDIKQAELYYTRSAFNNYVDAQCDLVALLKKEDSKQNINKIIYWLKEATENGSLQAKKQLEDYKKQLGKQLPKTQECEEAINDDYHLVMREDIERIEKYKEKAKLNKKDIGSDEYKKEIKKLQKLVKVYEELDIDKDEKEELKNMLNDVLNFDNYKYDEQELDDIENEEYQEEEEEENTTFLVGEKNETKEMKDLILRGYKLIQRGEKQEGFKLWQKAYELGSLTAAYNLAQFYDRGDGIERDAKKGFELFYQVANHNEENYDIVLNAQFNIGNAYFTANGVEKDYDEAFYWYERAADNGHSVAQYNMALAYYTGNHLPINFNQSFRYASKSVKNGFAQATPLLATLYFTGRGTEKDIQMAKKLYSIAAAQGDRGSKQVLDSIIADEKRNKKQ